MRNRERISDGRISAQNFNHCDGNSDLDEKHVQSMITSNERCGMFALARIYVGASAVQSQRERGIVFDLENMAHEQPEVEIFDVEARQV